MAATHQRNRVVELTPPGRGAIASLLVEGPDALAFVESEFRPRGELGLRMAEPGRLLVGRFGDPPGEEVVLRRRSDQALLLDCHGGSAAVARIRETLVRRGCTATSWREWLAASAADPLVAAALAALADTRTRRTAAILADQCAGALRRAVESIRAAIAAGNRQAAQTQLAALLAWANLGQHLTQAWRVVVAGPPNAGKSSLINALLGYRRAIVHPTPGTTRDLVTAETVVDGWPVLLVDTAGLRASPDPLEQEGIARARREMATADLVLLIFDRPQAWDAAAQRLCEEYPGAQIVHNKCDCPAAVDPGPRPAGVALSALSGVGLDALLGIMSKCLVPDPPPPGAPVPFTADQVRALRRAEQALRSDDLAGAQAALP